MKTTTLILTVLAAAGATAVHAASADDLKPTLDVTYASKYVFRGLQLAKASLQPSVEVATDNFYGGVHANEPITRAQKNEFDFYAAYDYALGKELKLDLGGTEYYYPQGYYTAGRSNNSFEGFAGLSGGNLAIAGLPALTPTLYTYYDFTRRNYTVQGSLGCSLPVKGCPVGFDFNATAGYVGVHAGADYTFWGGSLTMPYKFNHGKFTAGVEYSSSDLTGARHNLVYFTVGATVGF